MNQRVERRNEGPDLPAAVLRDDERHGRARDVLLRHIHPHLSLGRHDAGLPFRNPRVIFESSEFMTNWVTTPRGTPSLTLSSGAFVYVGPMTNSPSASLSSVGAKAKATRRVSQFIRPPVLKIAG